jgi:hypothetical protein
MGSKASGSQISWQSADEIGKVVSPTYRSPLPQILLEIESTQGHTADGRIMSVKNSNVTSWIEPATFWFIEQYLNQMLHRVIIPNSQ